MRAVPGVLTIICTRMSADTLRDRSGLRRLVGLVAVALLTWGISSAGAGAAITRWSAAVPLPEAIYSLSCPSTRLCVAGTSDGVYVSRDPDGGSRTWVRAIVPPTRLGVSTSVHGVACPSVSFCVAVDADTILTSHHPARGARAWKAVSIALPAQDSLRGVACGSERVCVAFATSDRESRCCAAPRGGRVITSTDPSGNGHAWRAAVLDVVPDGASCLPDVCLLATEDGDILIAEHPGRGAGAWRVAHEVGVPGKVSDVPVVACVSKVECLAPIAGITNRGELRGSLSNLAPFGWTFSQGFGGAPGSVPDSGVCLSSGFCAFGATAGSSTRGYGEVVSSGPSGRGWLREGIAADAGVFVSCPSDHFCVAGGAVQPNDGAASGVIVVGRG